MSRDSLNSPGGQALDSVNFSLEAVVRAFASTAGIIAILIGLWLSLKLFGAVAGGLQSPETHRETFRQWADLLGGDGLKIKQGENELQLSTPLAAAAVGLGLCLLVWLALGVMLTGAKVVSLTSTDREAVRRVLKSAFGPSGRPS